jgi:hypothetical protein
MWKWIETAIVFSSKLMFTVNLMAHWAKGLP